MKRILCVWFENWPIQRLAVDRADLRGRALAIFARAGRRGERVIACSIAAQRMGIRVDMPAVEAKSLVERKSRPPLSAVHLAAVHLAAVHLATVHLERHDPAADRRALERLSGWCDAFSPTVGIEEADRPECLLLDLTGLARLFGTEANLVGRLCAGFAKRGFAVHTGTGATIGAAWASAHFPSSFPSLPIEGLRLPEDMVRLLHELGIDRVGQLTALPRAALASRFGESLLERLDQATGRREETIVAHRPTAEPRAGWSLEYPTGSRKTIDAVLGRLLERVAEHLRRHDQGAIRLQCRLDCAERTSAALDVKLFRPTADASHWMKLIEVQRERQTLPGPVTAIHVWATPGPVVPHQHQLFTDENRAARRQLAVLVDQLSTYLGADRVLGTRLTTTAAPERTFRCEPLATQKAAGLFSSRPAKRVLTPFSPMQRPLHLLPRPEPLRGVTVGRGGLPSRFHYRRRTQRIAHHVGPERIETGWWRGRLMRRDYYRVETDCGTRFWIFRQLNDRKWFLHGIFE